MLAQPGMLVVWEFPRARFMVGFRKDGVVVLTCLEDLNESEHVDEGAAEAFAKGYTPSKDAD